MPERALAVRSSKHPEASATSLTTTRIPIYSNAGEAVYFVTGIAARQLPFLDFPTQVEQYYNGKNNYLVWFRDLDDPAMPDLKSILQHKNMMAVKEFPDGAVYVTK